MSGKMRKSVVTEEKEQNRTKWMQIRFCRAGLHAFILCILLVLVSGCAGAGKKNQETENTGYSSKISGEAENSGAEDAVTGFVRTGTDSFDSVDTAILMEINQQEGTITFWNRNVGRSYTLFYDGTTCLYDKYGESIALGQLEPGEIVEITFLKGKKHLTTLKKSDQAWNLEKVNFCEIDSVRGEVTIGQETRKLKLTDNTHCFSEGHSITLMELNPLDVLSFRGIDSEVLTIKVERGHGYLRLSGDEKFIGGWIEIGQSRIQKITEEMLLPVAEGTYRIFIDKNGSGGEKTAVIRKNEETVVDISDFEIAQPDTGTILFSLTPSNAKLYIDGEKTDTSLPVTLVYGIHQLIVRADGYQTVTQYVRVGQPSAGLDIVLDPVSTEKEEKKEDETPVDTATDYYKVYIDAPEGAEVYLDGNYVGISPCSFRKEAGKHTVTLRKTGYLTKSYTLQINDEKKDISYSFAEPEKQTDKAAGEQSVSQLLNDIAGTILK